jgi:hypothetical protein
MPGQLFIILDSYEDCIELLEKRSATYSGRLIYLFPFQTVNDNFRRMRLVMVNELMGWDFNFAWMTYG